MASRLKKQISQRPLESGNELDMLNREWGPAIREMRTVLDAITSGTAVITGSRSGDPIGVLTQALAALSALGIITDSTTP